MEICAEVYGKTGKYLAFTLHRSLDIEQKLHEKKPEANVMLTEVTTFLFTFLFVLSMFKESRMTLWCGS